MRIRDEKFGSGINIPDPQHCFAVNNVWLDDFRAECGGLRVYGGHVDVEPCHECELDVQWFKRDLRTYQGCHKSTAISVLATDSTLVDRGLNWYSTVRVLLLKLEY
jgi:hypothetical protein